VSTSGDDEHEDGLPPWPRGSHAAADAAASHLRDALLDAHRLHDALAACTSACAATLGAVTSGHVKQLMQPPAAPAEELEARFSEPLYGPGSLAVIGRGTAVAGWIVAWMSSIPAAGGAGGSPGADFSTHRVWVSGVLSSCGSSRGERWLSTQLRPALPGRGPHWRLQVAQVDDAEEGGGAPTPINVTAAGALVMTMNMGLGGAEEWEAIDELAPVPVMVSGQQSLAPATAALIHARRTCPNACMWPSLQVDAGAEELWRGRVWADATLAWISDTRKRVARLRAAVRRVRNAVVAKTVAAAEVDDAPTVAAAPAVAAAKPEAAHVRGGGKFRGKRRR